MVILDKYQDEFTEQSTSDQTDAPPSYETITAVRTGGQLNGGSARYVNEKSPRQSAFPPTPRSGSSVGASAQTSRTSQSNSSSWLSMLSFTSSRTSKQVRQTVLALIRDLVLSVESPDLLSSCADACRTYSLDLSVLLQEPFIEHHSAIYWGVLNRRDTLLPSLLAHAVPLSPATVSEIRLACLATSNQHLFQSLRCQREPFTKQMTPLSTSPGVDALVLGSMPADDVSIREIDGQGAFVAEMQINLWQKRMRVSGRVSVEFIARGRIWSLTFFSPPPTHRTTVGMWQVALCLLEHSPPTFIDSRLVIDVPPLPSPPNASQASDLISLSPSLGGPSGPIALSLTRSSPPPPSPSPPLPLNTFRPTSTSASKSKSKPKTPQCIEVRLKSTHRLAYRASNTFLAALDAAFSSQNDWTPPHVEQWTDNNMSGGGGSSAFTNAIVVPLDSGGGAELLYANSPFIAKDGTLRARLEARLGKPDATGCVIC